jgi:GTP-binding protein HflX
LEKLATRRVPPTEITTQELARQLTELSHEIKRQVGVLIDRKGHVAHVIVGDATRIVLPAQARSRLAESRFNGLRCLHTHLRGEPLTQDDLTDLALLRLDLMAAIDVDPKTGLPGLVKAAHILPTTSIHNENGESLQPQYQFLAPKPPSQLDVDFIEWRAIVAHARRRTNASAQFW